MIQAIAFVLLWSSGAIFVKLGLESSNSFTFLLLRLLLAWLVLGLIIFAQKTSRKNLLSILRDKKTLLKVIGIGFLLQGLYQLFFFLSIAKGVSPGILAIILGAQPILTVLVVRNKPIKKAILGIILGAAGLVMVVANTIAGSLTTTTGVFCSVLALILMTSGAIAQKKLPPDMNLLNCLFIQYIPGIILAAVCTFFGGFHLDFNFSFGISLLWMGLVISLLSNYMFYNLLKKHSIHIVTALFYFVPAITALYDYLFFGDKLSIMSLAGMVLIVVGIILMTRGFKHGGQHEKQAAVKSPLPLEGDRHLNKEQL